MDANRDALGAFDAVELLKGIANAPSCVFASGGVIASSEPTTTEDHSEELSLVLKMRQAEDTCRDAMLEYKKICNNGMQDADDLDEARSGEALPHVPPLLEHQSDGAYSANMVEQLTRVSERMDRQLAVLGAQMETMLGSLSCVDQSAVAPVVPADEVSDDECYSETVACFLCKLTALLVDDPILDEGSFGIGGVFGCSSCVRRGVVPEWFYAT